MPGVDGGWQAAVSNLKLFFFVGHPSTTVLQQPGGRLASASVPRCIRVDGRGIRAYTRMPACLHGCPDQERLVGVHLRHFAHVKAQGQAEQGFVGRMQRVQPRLQPHAVPQLCCTAGRPEVGLVFRVPVQDRPHRVRRSGKVTHACRTHGVVRPPSPEETVSTELPLFGQNLGRK